MTQPKPRSAHEQAAEPRPSAWIERWRSSIPVGARVLDFASGYGRNIPPLSHQGASVLAVDRDRRAVDAVEPPATALCADLEIGEWPLARGEFDAVVVCNYLFRPRFDLLADLLAPSGVLIYETFADGNARYGRPSSPAFLLDDGELFDGARRVGLTIIAYENGLRARPGPARVQRVCAVRPPVDFERFRLDPPVG